jgi:hypothetical protein
MIYAQGLCYTVRILCPHCLVVEKSVSESPRSWMTRLRSFIPAQCAFQCLHITGSGLCNETGNIFFECKADADAEKDATKLHLK